MSEDQAEQPHPISAEEVFATAVGRDVEITTVSGKMLRGPIRRFKVVVDSETHKPKEYKLMVDWWAEKEHDASEWKGKYSPRPDSDEGWEIISTGSNIFDFSENPDGSINMGFQGSSIMPSGRILAPEDKLDIETVK